MKYQAYKLGRQAALIVLCQTAINKLILIDEVEISLLPYDPEHELSVRDLPMGKLGMEEITYIRQAARSLFEWQHRYGSGPCQKVGITLLHEVSVAVQENQSAETAKALMAIMADLGHTVATMTWHLGMEGAAQVYYKLALRAAYANQDLLLGARILMGMSRQMLYLNQPQDALDLLNLAQQGTEKLASPQIMAMLYMRRALSLAALNCVDEFQREMDRAQNQLSKVDDDAQPLWLASEISSEKLLAVSGAGLRKLAKHNPDRYAELASQRTLAVLNKKDHEATRLTALEYISLAEDNFLLKNISLAVNYTHKAIDVAKHLHLNCMQVHKRLHELYSYTKRFLDINSVRKVNKRLRHSLVKLI